MKISIIGSRVQSRVYTERLRARVARSTAAADAAGDGEPCTCGWITAREVCPMCDGYRNAFVGGAR